MACECCISRAPVSLVLLDCQHPAAIAITREVVLANREGDYRRSICALATSPSEPPLPLSNSRSHHICVRSPTGKSVGPER